MCQTIHKHPNHFGPEQTPPTPTRIQRGNERDAPSSTIKEALLPAHTWMESLMDSGEET